MAALSGHVKHLATRARVVGVAAAAALVWAAVHRLPERSPAGIAGLLGRGVGGEVAEGDFVWEPSGGALADLWAGRGVLFLARTGPEEPRDLYRASVRVTPAGQPLFGGRFRRLTHTPYGDEEALDVAGGRAGFATRFQGLVQSIGVVDLAAGSLGRVAFAAPPPMAAFELTPDALVLALPSGPAELVWATEEVVGGASAGVRWVADAESPAGEPAPAAPAVVGGPDAGASATAAFPPAGFRAAGLGAPPAVHVRDEPGGRAIALDGRLLEFRLVAGSRLPGTRTGFLAPGEEAAGGDVEIALSLPVAPAAGHYDRPGWTAPIATRAAVVATLPSGELLLGAWPFDPWRDGGTSVAAELASPPSTSRWSLCATQSGHVVAASGNAELIGESTAHCVAAITGSGEIVAAGPAVDSSVSWPHPFPTTSLVAIRSRYGPTPPAPSGSWRALALGQPDPGWLPAVRVSRVDVLGARVDLQWMDAARFDWRILAGLGERSHRQGGDFPEELDAADRGRARIAFGVGVGKRRGPRGLRIGGSTGHRFGGRDGLLTLGDGFVAVLGADRGEAEPRADGTELPLSVEDGQLSPTARQRGPRQSRSDLCVMGAEVLLAEAEFDSHEATATALRDLGCQRAGSLDRGSDREARSTTEKPGPFQTSAVVALERTLKGRVGVFP